MDRSVPIATALASLLLALTGCGDDGDGNVSRAPGGGGPSAGAAGRGGQSSAGDTGQGGSLVREGGAGGSAIGGDRAGSAGAGTAGAGATAGGSPDDNALNPALPPPSFDCLNATDAQCLSIRGTVGGRAVDSHCTLEFLAMTTIAEPKAWAMSCREGETRQVALYDLVTVPVQPVGAFEYDFAPSTPYAGASVTAAYDDAGGSSAGDNLVGGKLKGDVLAETGIGVLVSGTFRLTTNAPSATACDPGAPATCAAVDVHGTFRFLHSTTE